MNTETTTKTGEGNAPRTLSTCKHCGRGINLRNGVWIDPKAKGDDAIWGETCDSHDTFTAEHEPVLVKQDANARITSGLIGAGFWARCGVFYAGGYRTERGAINAVLRKVEARRKLDLARRGIANLNTSDLPTAKP